MRRQAIMRVTIAAMTAAIGVLTFAGTPATAANAQVTKVRQVSSLAEYVQARQSGVAAATVGFTYGSLDGRGPQAQESKVLDVANWGTADRSRVQLWDYLTTGNYTNQRWFLNDAGTNGGYSQVTIENGNAIGKCLDESRDKPAADGTAVYIYGCSNESNPAAASANQRWKIVPWNGNSGYFYLQNAYDGRVLDVANYNYSNGAGLQMWHMLPAPGSWNQAWA